MALFACNRDTPAKPVTSAVDAAAEDAAPEAAAPEAKDELDAGGPLAWPDAIRVGRFREAADGLAKLSPEEQAKPEVRLARARVALMTGKAADAVAALTKLEDELPLLRDLIGKTRALAMFEAGPFDKAADLLSQRREVSMWVLAAQAWDKASDGTKARAAWDRVASASGRTRAQEEQARLRRMQLTRLKDGEPAAVADARWLAVNALDEAAHAEAVEVLDKATQPLKAAELLARAKALADAMRTDEALRAVEKATAKGGASLVDLCRAKAEVYYRARTRYSEAALVYRQCSGLGGAHAAEDAFLSARAFSRADRDAEAVLGFKNVMAAYKGSTYADQAEFHVARTHALARRWKDAALAFDDYVKHWPAGKERREAERYRALSWLQSKKDDKKARTLLEGLVGSAEDPITAARWTNLAALAALHDGDRLHAIARWTDVARSQPLSYPALVARARLKEDGATLPPLIDPAVAGTSEPLAIELPAPADMLHRIGFDAEAEEALKEHEPAVAAKFPARRTEALCAAYAELDRAKRLYQISLQVPSVQIGTAPGGKNRHAWECVFPKPYPESVRPAGAASRIGPELVWAVMRQESAFDPDVVSPARAVGLMQLLPETAKTTASHAKIEHDDSRLVWPSQSITLGALYLRELLDKLGQNTTLSVAAYNAGPEAIQRWLGRAKGETLDVFVEAIPFVETRGYVARVMGNLSRYGYLEKGEPGVPTIALSLNPD
ncbi:MAG: transglycosylase SLT domain-containing protein [Labilithrix sp.]|nr:transglycosylase SLT domain-containing protein [Labilithrix sp.]MCW5810576.1 transglycosylase SLT domain-containing protein [Labilithrix sp.]